MKKSRYLRVALLGLGLVIAAAVAAIATRPTGNARANFSSPPVSLELRQMLGQISTTNMQASINKLVGFGTRNTLSSQDDPVRGVGAARDWIKQQLDTYAAASGGRLTTQLQTFVQPVSPGIPVPTPITNVVATLHGPATPERIYVVGAHYDSRATDPLDSITDAPGADDDASGVAAVLELARVMSTHNFDATIEFVLFGGEEQGQYGSNFFAAQSQAAGDDIEGMFSNDIIGSSLGQNGLRDRRDVRLFAEGPPANETSGQAANRALLGGENDSPTRELARFVKDATQFAVPSMNVWIINRRDRLLGKSDHVSFLNHGFPAARLTEPNEDFRHQHQNVQVVNGVQFGDLPSFIDLNYLAGVTKVNLAALTALANGPAAPRDVQIDTSQSPDTQLQWINNSDTDLAGYEIVWRDTTDQNWTHVIRVGNVTSFTLKGINKDNFLFGVRAVDKSGNRSVVSFPRPL